jgi:hypothetical protein
LQISTRPPTGAIKTGFGCDFLSFAFSRLANKNLQQQKNLFDRNKSKIGALTIKGDAVSQVFYRNTAAYNVTRPPIPHCHCQELSTGRRMSVQLSSAIKEGLHGTIAIDPAKQNLLRRASMQTANTDLSAGLVCAADVTTSTLLPLIKRCAVVSQVHHHTRTLMLPFIASLISSPVS